MKIATWNVNSLRARLAHVQQWLASERPEVLLLQETKVKDDSFPQQELEACGYHSAHFGQAAYNGVAILSTTPLSDVVRGNPHRPHDAQARLIAATVGGVRVLSAYVPNGQSVGSEKYAYKLEWLDDFATYLQTLADGATVAGGDYNIAPGDDDIYDAEEWGQQILASPPERAALAALLEQGYADAHTLFAPRGQAFTWWDYRAASYARNRGMRIDLMLVSDAAARRCAACAPDETPRGWVRPSDHAPVTLALE